MVRCTAKWRRFQGARRHPHQHWRWQMHTMHTHTTIAKVARALAEHAEEISVALLGEPSSQSRREFRWGRRGSIWLGRAGTDRGRWYDHENGEGGDLIDLIARQRGVELGEAIGIAVRNYLGGVDAPSLQRRPEPPSSSTTDGAEAHTRWALCKWQEATPIAGTLGERYFIERRKLDIARLDLGHCLRWHAGIRAIMALMTDPVSNDAIGIHRTYLGPDGAKLGRKMLGRQGVVCLSPNAEVTMGLGITEGVEDGLAVLSGWAPVWAATSAGAIARFPTLSGIEALTVFADADGPGIRAAEACAARWRSAGREVCILHGKGV
jgi:putative DNA primase/helicase